jgi:asparagine synthase (glutamine-hydrolysing)
MSVQINLKNPFYKWVHISKDDISFYLKGTFYYNGNLVEHVDFIDIIENNLKSEGDSISELLQKLNGNFSLLIDTEKFIICAVDRIRSIPLFYSRIGSEIIISDDANFIREKINPKIDENSAAELLVTGYVTGKDTLYYGIKQLQAGEFLIYDKLKDFIDTDFYFQFLYRQPLEFDEEKILDKLDDCLVNVFNRLIESSVKQDLQIVVPLSGGLDSRIIVAMLKRLGINDVICFTYGRKNDHEVKISREVAKALGYEWHFVEYTHNNWYEYYHSNEMREYQLYAGNLSSLPHRQDLLAIQILKNRGILTDKVLLVPGHTGDMLSGGHIPSNINNDDLDYNLKEVVQLLLEKHYLFFKWDVNSNIRDIFELKIKDSIKIINVHNKKTVSNAIEIFDYNERQAKYIVNSVRAYEYFGLKWGLPLWDLELIEQFLKTPLKLRFDRTIYKKYALKRLFIKSQYSLSKIECTTPINQKSGFNRHICHKYIAMMCHILFDVRWGRHFKRPIIDRFKLRIKKAKHQEFKELTLLNQILEQNEEPFSFPGYQTLDYIKMIIK